MVALNKEPYLSDIFDDDCLFFESALMQHLKNNGNRDFFLGNKASYYVKLDSTKSPYIFTVSQQKPHELFCHAITGVKTKKYTAKELCSYWIDFEGFNVTRDMIRSAIKLAH